jgi:uncharacterized protein
MILTAPLWRHRWPLARRMAGLAMLVLAALLGPAAQAQAPAPAGGPVFPELTGRVVDGADILTDAQEAQLAARSAAFEERSSDQIVVATLASLQGYEIEEFGYRLLRHWQLGQAGLNNGVLLIVAPNERKMRIEVGYGLEGVLPDIIAGQIIREDMVPKFREGDLPGGIDAGFSGIERALSASPDELAERLRRGAREVQPEGGIGDALAIFIIIVVVLIVIAMNSGGGGRRGRFRRSRGAWSAGPVIVHDWSSGSSGGWSGGGGFGGGGFGGGGGFSGGGGSSGGGGASGSW